MAKTSKKSLNSMDRLSCHLMGLQKCISRKTCWKQHDILDRYWPLAASNGSGMFKGHPFKHSL